MNIFRWRQEDAHRNTLNTHCYWMLRKSGHAVGEATAQVKRLNRQRERRFTFHSRSILMNFQHGKTWYWYLWKDVRKSGFKS